jgi:hypothetical protein
MAPQWFFHNKVNNACLTLLQGRHSRMLLSGIQNVKQSTNGFPLETCGNDDMLMLGTEELLPASPQICLTPQTQKSFDIVL